MSSHKKKDGDIRSYSPDPKTDIKFNTIVGDGLTDFDLKWEVYWMEETVIQNIKASREHVQINGEDYKDSKDYDKRPRLGFEITVKREWGLLRDENNESSSDDDQKEDENDEDLVFYLGNSPTVMKVRISEFEDMTGHRRVHTEHHFETRDM